MMSWPIRPPPTTPTRLFSRSYACQRTSGLAQVQCSLYRLPYAQGLGFRVKINKCFMMVQQRLAACQHWCSTTCRWPLQWDLEGAQRMGH